VDTIPVSGITSETPEYKAKFASGKLPGFETRDGFTLFRGSAIARYSTPHISSSRLTLIGLLVASLAPSSELLGTSPTDAALVDQWVSYFESEILSGEDTFWAFLADEVLYNQLHETVLRERLHEHLVVVNTHLTHNTFFLPTNRISLADITGAAVIMDIFRFYLGPADRAKYPALVRLLETVANHPEIKAIFGSLRFMDFPAVFVSPSQEESSPEPGAKNPLDDLPRSTFKLRDWKRAYSNIDARGAGGSLEWFYGK
jgi:elongation factor 1-gamma